MLLEKARLAELRATFAETSGRDQKIGQAEFEKALGLADPHFNKRLFDIFDYDKSGMISQQEFLDSVEQLVDGSLEDKLRFVFQIHDEDGNGRIEKVELIQIFEFSLDRHRLSFSES